MARKTTTPGNTAQKKIPMFEPCKVLGADMPFICTDAAGKVWRIDPNSGTAKEVEFR